MSKDQQQGSIKLPYTSIATAWEYLRRKAMKTRGGVSERQMVEMRKLFYAGASCCFDLLYYSPEGESEKDGVNRMASIQEEFIKFANTLT